MRTNTMKQLAEEHEEEYNEYVYECHKMGIAKPLDIYSWVAERRATEEEYRNDAVRDDLLTEKDNV